MTDPCGVNSLYAASPYIALGIGEARRGEGKYIVVTGDTNYVQWGSNPDYPTTITTTGDTVEIELTTKQIKKLRKLAKKPEWLLYVLDKIQPYVKQVVSFDD